MSDPEDLDFVVLDDKELQDYNTAGLLPQSPEDIQEIKEWLQPTAYGDSTSEYIRHLGSHVKGTGDWLPETDKFRQWHDGDTHLLWIKANPGAGKSVIAAHQRARLAVSEHVPVLHFFFRQIITTNRTPVQLVRDWLAQLLPFSPILQKRLKGAVVDERRSLSSHDFLSFWDMFKESARSLHRLYCFADALDEMSLGHDDFFTHLLELERIKSCKVFVTSRPVPHIVRVLRDSSAVQITLGSENMSDDISVYVDHRIEKDISRYVEHRILTSGIDLGNQDSREAILPLIRSSLELKSQGSFLYTKLVLDNLLDALRGMNGHFTPDSVRHVLRALPSGLTDMYGKMLRDHARRTGTPQELQQTLLSWVTHSERPLRMLELAAVIDSDIQLPDSKAVIRTACGPLLEIMPSDVVGPVHHSFTEYLTAASIPALGKAARFPLIETGPTHLFIAKQCLKYLVQVYHDEAGPQGSRVLLQQQKHARNITPFILARDQKLKYPFLDYAVRYWTVHSFKAGALDTELLNLLDEFLIETADARETWVEMNLPQPLRYLGARSSGPHLRYPKESETLPWPSTITPMHIAAKVGLADYILHLSRTGHDVDATDICNRSPIHFAAESGQVPAVEALLAAGASADNEDGIASRPLMLAAQEGHAGIIELLVAAGADPGIAEGYDDENKLDRPFRLSRMQPLHMLSPIDTAIRRNHVAATRFLLKYHQPRMLQAQLETMSVLFRTAMNLGHVEIAQTIISDSKFDPNAFVEDRFETTPLEYAVCYLQIDVIRSLIEKGASVLLSNKAVPPQSELHRPLLHSFIENAAKQDASTRENKRRVLSMEEVEAGIKMLLSAGCDLEANDQAGRAALFYARSNFDLVSSLVSLGARIDKATDDGSNPLHDIAGYDRKAMEFWLKQGFDINSRNLAGNTPLHVALGDHKTRSADSDLAKRVQYLLRLGSDPNMPSYVGLTPLHMAAGLPETVRILLAAGAEIESRDVDGNTPLVFHSQASFIRSNDSPAESCEPLLDAGANEAATDIQGSTAFLQRLDNCAMYTNNLEEKWYSRPDLRIRDTNGANTALIFCRCVANVSQLQRFKDAGADFHAKDYAGNTALHYAATVRQDFGDQRRLSTPLAREETVGRLQKLIDWGVDPRQENLHGQTALHLAVTQGTKGKNGMVAIDFFLNIKCELDINSGDTRGLTPLHIAVSYSAPLTDALVQRGADPTRLTKTGQSALHFAAVARQVDVIALLLTITGMKGRESVNRRDNKGRTALFYAARSGCHEAVKMLLDAGADPNAADCGRRSPLNACADFAEEQELWMHTDQVAKSQSIPLQSMSQNSRLSCRRGGKALKDMIFRVLEKPWEPLIRSMAGKCPSREYVPSMHARAEPFPSVRQCVKYLLAGGARVALPSFGRFGPGGLRNTANKRETRNNSNALIDALDKESHAMAEELLDAIGFDAVLSQQNLLTAHEILQIRMLRATRQSISAMLQTDLRTHGSAEVFQYLISQDRADMISIWLSARLPDMDSQAKADLQRWLGELATIGLENAFQTCVETLKITRHAATECPSDNWSSDPMLLKFTSCPLDNHLIKVCAWDTSSHNIVKAIVEKADCTEREKECALHHMASKPKFWHLKAIEYLVDSGTDVNCRSPNGATPLMVACGIEMEFLPKTRLVRLLLRLGADTSLKDNAQNSCLDHAAPFGDIVRLLLADGIDVKLGARKALVAAVRQDDVATVRLLLEHGVVVREIEDDGTPRPPVKQTPRGPLNRVTCGISEGPLSLIDGCCRSVDRMTSWRPNRREVLRLLLEHGADPFLCVQEGTPIIHHLTSANRDVEMIVTQPGFDLERRDANGRTLLLAAASLGNNMQTLLRCGADLSATDNDGQNVLHLLSARKPHIERNGEGLLELVLQQPNAHLLLNARCKSGWRPVQRALESRRWPDVERLVKHGADMTIVDPSGNTVFHHLLDVPKLDLVRESLCKTMARIATQLIDCQSRGEARTTDPSLPTLELGEYRSLDPNTLNAAGEPAMFSFVRNIEPKPEVFSALLSPSAATADEPGQTDGVERWQDYAMSMLHKAGLRLNAKSRDGRSLLHAFASRQIWHHSHAGPIRLHRPDGKVEKTLEERIREIWTLMVDHGFDPYAEDEGQRSALDVASACGNVTILEMY